MTNYTDKKMLFKEVEQQAKGVVLSHHEIEILRFVHEFGFCEIGQIMKRFDLRKSSAYLHMQLLVRLGLVLHLRIALNRPGVYYLTTKSIRLLDLDLPVLERIPLSVYDHQLAVVNVHLQCRERYRDTVWISERRLIKDKYIDTSNLQDHLPDGAIVFPDGSQCAIEVERSLKSRKRIEAILLEYGLQRTFKEVWYFGSERITSVIKEMANSMAFIKTFDLEEFLK